MPKVESEVDEKQVYLQRRWHIQPVQRHQRVFFTDRILESPDEQARRKPSKSTLGWDAYRDVSSNSSKACKFELKQMRSTELSLL